MRDEVGSNDVKAWIECMRAMIPRCASSMDREFVSMIFHAWFVHSIDSDADCKYEV